MAVKKTTKRAPSAKKDKIYLAVYYDDEFKFWTVDQYDSLNDCMFADKIICLNISPNAKPKAPKKADFEFDVV